MRLVVVGDANPLPGGCFQQPLGEHLIFCQIPLDQVFNPNLVGALILDFQPLFQGYRVILAGNFTWFS